MSIAFHASYSFLRRVQRGCALWAGNASDDSRIAAGPLFLQKNAACDEVGLGYFPGAKGSLDYCTAQGSSAIFTSTPDADRRVSALKSLAGIPLYTFVLDSADQDLSALQRLATQTNGAMLYASLEASCCWSLSAINRH
ncbi:hypothetical protein [Burkholderia anthina]|uniref:hypothetical protein n=1 Tax=Burkholderia anthina TaxID=179879 RepID=UPI00158A96FD|nr:hypothetical protein [Burkholderia anthina]